MTPEQRLQFIDDELKGLWPQWDPTEAEIRVWMGILADPGYAPARTALQQCFCEPAGNYHRSKLAGLLAKLKALAPHAAGPGRGDRPDLQTSVFIECLEPPAGHPHLAGLRKPVFVGRARQGDPDHVLACAELMRRRFEQLYGGRWITVRTPPQEDAALSAPSPVRS